MTSPTPPPQQANDLTPNSTRPGVANASSTQPPAGYRARRRRPHQHARRQRAAVVAALAFVGSIVAANWLTGVYGLIPVGFGLTATAGTFAAGYTLFARDQLHDLGGRRAVLAGIATGAVLSAVLAAPQLALASASAFAVSELADLLVYQPLRRRGFVRAVVASNAVGAPLDTIVFLALAGLPIWATLPGQLWAKAPATLVPLAAAVAVRALLRHRFRPRRP